MALSYHGVVGSRAKVTLPSVDTWSSNMNILRDPPKSITTRKIDKVGETSDITQMIQDSGDRACEAINVYARGVNPMVAVSYGNYGNNGGQRVNGQLTGKNFVGGQGSSGVGNSGTQSFLPYRVMRDGAFRPPVRDQRDLLPLSRLPRVWTSSFTQPGFADYSKKAFCPGAYTDYRQVKNSNQILKACIRPTATYQIQTPVTETYEVKNVIQNPIQISGHSGLQPQAKVNAEPGKNVSYIIHEPIRSEVILNKGSSNIQKNSQIDHFDTDKYTQETLHSNVRSNTSQDIQHTPIHELFSVDTNNRTREQMNIGYTANQVGHNKNEYIHDDINLKRSLPQYEARTNTRQNIHMQVIEPVQELSLTNNRPTTSMTTNHGSMRRQAIDNISSRNFNLKPTVTAGGYDPTPSMPSIQRQQEITEFDNQKSQMRDKIYQMQMGRNMEHFVPPGTPIYG